MGRHAIYFTAEEKKQAKTKCMLNKDTHWLENGIISKAKNTRIMNDFSNVMKNAVIKKLIFKHT